MYALIVKTTFEASHVIPGHTGKCARLHGHTYRVEAEFVGEALDELGMVQDFSALRKALDDLLPDHRHLNDVLDVAPTAENIARWIYERLEMSGLPVTSVTVWETDRYGCRYTPSPTSVNQGGR